MCYQGDIPRFSRLLEQDEDDTIPFVRQGSLPSFRPTEDPAPAPQQAEELTVLDIIV